MSPGLIVMASMALTSVRDFQLHGALPRHARPGAVATSPALSSRHSTRWVNAPSSLRGQVVGCHGGDDLLQTLHRRARIRAGPQARRIAVPLTETIIIPLVSPSTA